MPENYNEIQNAQGLIIYEISDQKFCTDIAKINNILKMKFVELPENFSKNISTKIIIDDYQFHLLNLSKLLRLKEKPISEKTRLLLFDYSNVKFYFMVDQIHHIVIHDAQFKDTEEVIKPQLHNDFLIGAIDFENSEVSILDLEKIGRSFSTTTHKENSNQH